MDFKELTVEDIKRDYSARHGFIFTHPQPSDRKNCELVEKTLIQAEFTTSDVDFVVVLNPNTFVFVYPEGISFDMPRFMAMATGFSRMFGWQVETLINFSKR
jgi:hypothetical protein